VNYISHIGLKKYNLLRLIANFAHSVSVHPKRIICHIIRLIPG